jgi:hypothetical protein
MKVEVNKKDIVKHFGIWVKSANEWLCSHQYMLMAFTCPRVANAQHDIVLKSGEFKEEDLEVREIK